MNSGQRFVERIRWINVWTAIILQCVLFVHINVKFISWQSGIRFRHIHARTHLKLLSGFCVRENSGGICNLSRWLFVGQILITVIQFKLVIIIIAQPTRIYRIFIVKTKHQNEMDENRIMGNNDGKTYPFAWLLCISPRRSFPRPCFPLCVIRIGD